MLDEELRERIVTQKSSKDAKEWKFPEFRTGATTIGEFYIDDEIVRITVEELIDTDGTLLRFVRQDWAENGDFVTYEQDGIGELPELELTQEELVRLAKFSSHGPLLIAGDLALNHSEVPAPEGSRDPADMITFIGIKAPPDSGKTTFLSFANKVLGVNVKSADLGNNYCLPLLNRRVNERFGPNAAEVANRVKHEDILSESTEMRKEKDPYEDFPRGKVTIRHIIDNVHRSYPFLDAFAGREFEFTSRKIIGDTVVQEKTEIKKNEVPRVIYFDTSGLPYLTEKRSDSMDEMVMGLDGVLEVGRGQLELYVQDPITFRTDSDKVVERAIKVRIAFLNRIEEMTKEMQ